MQQPYVVKQTIFVVKHLISILTLKIKPAYAKIYLKQKIKFNPKYLRQRPRFITAEVLILYSYH